METGLQKENVVNLDIQGDQILPISSQGRATTPLHIENHEMSFTDLSEYGRSVLGEQSFTKWLITHNPHLQNRPVELLMTKEGMKKVLDELIRIKGRPQM